MILIVGMVQLNRYIASLADWLADVKISVFRIEKVLMHNVNMHDILKWFMRVSVNTHNWSLPIKHDIMLFFSAAEKFKKCIYFLED